MDELAQALSTCWNFIHDTTYTWGSITFTLWDVMWVTALISAAGALIAVGLDRD